MTAGERRDALFGLPRPVWLLGWISFLTDAASETIYPLLPFFLTRVLGAGAMSLGVIEGVAEAANSVLKVVSGWLSDRTGTPKRLVLAGYSISSSARPLIGLVTAWPQVLVIRFTDRLGKGIRSSPRDAMLARFAPAEMRGRVYGFHRAMDHAGAVVGPLLATAYLWWKPDAFRSLFALTVIPGAIVVLVILLLPSDNRGGSPGTAAFEASIASGEGRHEPLPTEFTRAMAVIGLFSLGNSTDAFLLLRLSDLGIAEFWIPLLWSMLHVVKMTSSYVGGTLSDSMGRRTLVALGYLWYALVYALFAWVARPAAVVGVFLAYGIYFGLTEGVEKAWVADLAPRARRGTAFGIYNAVLGFGSLAASLLFGYLWTRVSPQAAFLTGAALAIVASALLATLFAPNPRTRTT